MILKDPRTDVYIEHCGHSYFSWHLCYWIGTDTPFCDSVANLIMMREVARVRADRARTKFVARNFCMNKAPNFDSGLLEDLISPRLSQSIVSQKVIDNFKTRIDEFKDSLDQGDLKIIRQFKEAVGILKPFVTEFDDVKKFNFEMSFDLLEFAFCITFLQHLGTYKSVKVA